MSNPRRAIQQAIFERLSAASLGVPVGSRIGDNTPPPFITIDAITLTGPMTKDGGDWEVTVEVSAVVEARSPGPLGALAEGMTQALDGRQLTADGVSLTTMHMTTSAPETTEDRLLHIERQTYSLFATTT